MVFWFNHFNICEMNANGIARLNKPDRRITIEGWPWDGNGQVKVWPITLELSKLCSRQAAAWLPTLEIEGLPDVVVQIIDEASGEIICTTRTRQGRYRPNVFRPGAYTICVSDPDTGRNREFPGVQSNARPDAATLTVRFE